MNKYQCKTKDCDKTDCPWKTSNEGQIIKKNIGIKYIPKKPDSPGWELKEECLYYNSDSKRD